MSAEEVAKAIAKGNAITIEAKVRSYSKRADGGINIGLAVHPHGIPSGMREIEIGDRFYVAMFQIDDNEQPAAKEVVPDTRDPKSSTGDKNRPASESPSAPVRAKVKPGGRLAQLAGMLAKTPLFHRYLEAKRPGTHCTGEEHAAGYIRGYCFVGSRSEIVPETPAADKFLNLYDDFVRWRDADQYVEA